MHIIRKDQVSLHRGRLDETPLGLTRRVPPGPDQKAEIKLIGECVSSSALFALGVSPRAFRLGGG